MCLLGGIGRDHLGALRHDARDRRAGVAEHMAAGAPDHLGVTAAVGDFLQCARREHPQRRVRTDAPPLQQARDLPDLLDGIVRTSEHDEIDIVRACRGIQLLIGDPPLGLSIDECLARPAAAEGAVRRARLGRDAGHVIHLDPAGARRRGTEMFQLDLARLRRQSTERRDVLLDHLADRVPEQAPVHHVVDRHPHIDEMGGEPVLRDVQPEIGNAPGDTRCPRALAPLGVGARAEHGVAIDHGRGFHPGAVLAHHRHVADLIRRAGGEHVDALGAEKRLPLLLHPHRILGDLAHLRVLAVDAHDQVAGVGLDRRHLHLLGAVEIEFGEDRVTAPAGELADHRTRRHEGAADIVGRHQALGAERLAIAHQQIHGLLHGRPVAAVQHLLFVITEFHGSGARVLWGVDAACDLMAAHLALQIVAQPRLQRADVDLVHAAVAREVERMGRGGAHRDARPHHAHARQRRIVRIDAAAGDHDVVGVRRSEAAERHIMHVIITERAPDMVVAGIVQLDRPGRARDRVVELPPRHHVVDGELLAAANPAGLTHAGEAVGAHARLAERLRKLAFQKSHRAVGLLAAFQGLDRHLERIERGLHMRHVHGGHAAAGNDEAEPFAAKQAVLLALLPHPPRQLFAARHLGFVDAFEHHHLGAEHRTVRRLLARKAGLPDQRRIAAGVDEACGGDTHVAVTRGEPERPDPPVHDLNLADDRAEQHGDPGVMDRGLDPAAERHFVIDDDVVDALPVVDGTGPRQIADDVLRDPVGHLVAIFAVGEHAADGADDRIHRLPAQHRQAVDQQHPFSEPCGLDRRRGAGDAGADHAHIGITHQWLAAGSNHRARRCRSLGPDGERVCSHNCIDSLTSSGRSQRMPQPLRGCCVAMCSCASRK